MTAPDPSLSAPPLPDVPPPPGLDDDGMKRLPRAALRVDQGYAATVGVLTPLLVGGAFGLLLGLLRNADGQLGNAAESAAFGAVALAGLVVPLRVFVTAPLAWSRFRYRIEPDFVRIRRGVFIHRQLLIPLVRVQNVDTAQGPLERRFNLADVRLHNAATTHTIPNLDADEAELLREQLAELVRRARDVD